MTAHYARITDQTVRRRREAATKVNINGERVAIDPEGPLAQAQWAKTRYAMATQTLPNGYCGPPLQRTCPHANAPLTCPVFLTGPEFLPELREQQQRTLTLIDVSERNGQARMVEMNQQVLANLNRMISEIEKAATYTRPRLGGREYRRGAATARRRVAVARRRAAAMMWWELSARMPPSVRAGSSGSRPSRVRLQRYGRRLRIDDDDVGRGDVHSLNVGSQQRVRIIEQRLGQRRSDREALRNASRRVARRGLAGNRIREPRLSIGHGVMSTRSIFGPPLTMNVVPWALMVVPCGIDAMPTKFEYDSAGCCVDGTITTVRGSR